MASDAASAFPGEAYHPKRHAAAHTDEYLFAQLIPYLGNKRKLLGLIAEAVARTGVMAGTFGDFFAGGGVVSRWAKQQGFRVVSNDWEPYASVLGGCFVRLNAPPFLPDVFAELNALAGESGYLARHFCPADDLHPDPLRERCFFTRANGGRLDAMREWIVGRERAGLLTSDQRDYLLAPLLYAASYVSNTSGVFKAYHHGWGGRTGTALYRILSQVTLMPPVLCDNGQENVVTRMDAQSLAAHWADTVGGLLDIAYLDPPYNQHPYGSNYHLLNTLALWDKPPLPPVSRGVKSAIRTDWRTLRRSAYNHTSQALEALTLLVDTLPSRWVLLSYSTDGNIPLEPLLEALAGRGAASLIPRRYKRYRVSTQRMSPRPHTTEFVLILDKNSSGDLDQVQEMQSALREAAV